MKKINDDTILEIGNLYLNGNTYQQVMEYPKSRIYQLRSCDKKSLQKIYNHFYLENNYIYLNRKKLNF